MTDAMIPSYRVARDRSGPSWRMLAVAGGLLGVLAFAGALSWGLSRGGPETVPVIEADSRPLKVRPENPGGLVVANTDQLVLEAPAIRRAAQRELGAGASLAPAPEAPQLDLLRQQAAPPAPPVAAARPPVEEPPFEEPPAVDPEVAALPPIAAPSAAPAATPVAAPVPPVPAAPPARPAAASLPPPVPERPASGGRALVQLGALASEEAARSEWARLQRRVPELAGRQPQVIRFDRGEGQPPLWRLRTGGLADRDAARSLCDAVRAGGGACMAIGG